MSTLTMPQSKDEVARELARSHYSLDAGMQKIFRLRSPDEQEQDFREPVKLLEVNEDTVAAGIQPLHFGSHTHQDKWYPPVIVVVVTPEEFEDIQAGRLTLPNSWTLAAEYPKEKAG